jgi:hypothetical protein
MITNWAEKTRIRGEAEFLRNGKKKEACRRI